jgi:hypothetical protein
MSIVPHSNGLLNISPPDVLCGAQGGSLWRVGSAGYSLSEPVKPSLRMETQLIITTATQPARPVKNITSNARIAQIITFNVIVRFETDVSP